MPKVLNKWTDKIPPDAILVDRTTKYGNPMTLKELKRLFPNDIPLELHQKAVSWYEGYLLAYLKVYPEFLLEIKKLRGHDLVCWDTPFPCHADILLRLAN